MDYIAVANLNKTFGIKGEFRAYCLTDFPKQRFQKGNKYLIRNEKTGKIIEWTLLSYRMDNPFVVLRFEEITSINEAENFIGWKVCINKEEATLPKDTYHIHDLIGCEIYLEKGDPIGVCVDVFSYSSTMVLRVKREGKEDAQIPFVKSFVKEVDIDSKHITITPIEGML